LLPQRRKGYVEHGKTKAHLKARGKLLVTLFKTALQGGENERISSVERQVSAGRKEERIPKVGKLVTLSERKKGFRGRVKHGRQIGRREGQNGKAIP